MKIRTRILLYNTLMVLLSLIVLLAVGSSVIGVWGFWKWDDNSGTEQAEALINQLSATSSFEEADRRLEDLGYSLYVLQPAGSTAVYTGDTDGSLMHALEDEVLEKARIYNLGDDQIIARRLSPYLLIALQTRADESTPSPRSLLIWFLVVGAAAILVIMPITSLFTRKLLKHITRPLAALTGAAGRVETGDLSTPIEYHGVDEFRAVCDAFNHMQEHLKSERDKNAAYERARTDMISGISHDLRTPLTSVKGYIKGISDGIANTPEKQQRYLQTAYSKANEMDKLLEKLFFFSKLETGNLPMNKRPIDLSDFIRNYVRDASLDPDLQNVMLTADVSDTAHTVLADAEQLRRVFNNLTDNALKYAHADPLRIRIWLDRADGWEIVFFSDNGHGVPENQLSSLFEQFWRADSARQSGSNSSGLGLYIVKHIIDGHGGSIRAENADGLRLIIRLPACAAGGAAPTKEETV